MVRGSRKSGGACCRGQRGGDHCHGGHKTTQSGGDAHKRQCGSGRGHNHDYKMRGGDHCHGGHAKTQSGGDAHKRQCGAGYGYKLSGGDAHRRQCGAGRKGKRGTRGKGKGKGRSRSRGKGRRASRKMGGSRKTYSVRGGACNASSIDLGHTLDLSDNIRGRAAVVRQRGGEAHNNLKYDCSQPEWGPECR